MLNLTEQKKKFPSLYQPLLTSFALLILKLSLIRPEETIKRQLLISMVSPDVSTGFSVSGMCNEMLLHSGTREMNAWYRIFISVIWRHLAICKHKLILSALFLYIWNVHFHSSGLVHLKMNCIRRIFKCSLTLRPNRAKSEFCQYPEKTLVLHWMVHSQ